MSVKDSYAGNGHGNADNEAVGGNNVSQSSWETSPEGVVTQFSNAAQSGSVQPGSAQSRPVEERTTTKGIHPILSFVRRSGRLSDRLQRARNRYADRYLMDVNDSDNPLGVRPGLIVNRNYVREHWVREGPLLVEVGSGQGENVVAAAIRETKVNFLAVEVYQPGVAHTMLLAGKADVGNLRIAPVNAPALLAACDNDLIAEIWTFFPDPWPKTKHHKRRLIQTPFAKEVQRVLRDGGLWRISTDIDDYALHIHEVMDTADGFHNDGDHLVSLPAKHVGKATAELSKQMPYANFVQSPRFDGRVLTNFEKKGIEAGRRIHDFCYRKI